MSCMRALLYLARPRRTRGDKTAFALVDVVPPIDTIQVQLGCWQLGRSIGISCAQPFSFLEKNNDDDHGLIIPCFYE